MTRNKFKFQCSILIHWFLTERLLLNTYDFFPSIEDKKTHQCFRYWLIICDNTEGSETIFKATWNRRVNLRTWYIICRHDIASQNSEPYISRPDNFVLDLFAEVRKEIFGKTLPSQWMGSFESVTPTSLYVSSFDWSPAPRPYPLLMSFPRIGNLVSVQVYNQKPQTTHRPPFYQPWPLRQLDTF